MNIVVCVVLARRPDSDSDDYRLVSAHTTPEAAIKEVLASAKEDPSWGYWWRYLTVESE